MMEWISVKDRLPDEDTIDVLAYNRYGEYMVAYVAENYPDGWATYGMAGVSVDYWMPLPEPPEDIE